MARKGKRSSRRSVFAPFGMPAGTSTQRKRIVVGRIVLVAILVVAVARLADVQTLQAHALSTQAEQERVTEVDIPADRGTITDRDGTKLAFSVATDALSMQPKRFRAQWHEASAKGATDGVGYDQHAKRMASYLKKRLGDDVDEQDLLAKLRSDRTFCYIDEQVEPSVAKDIVTKYPSIALQQRAQRRYPNGPVASSLLGFANWRKNTEPPGLHGVLGLEGSLDDKLSGTPGQQLVDTEAGNNKVVIPGTQRDLHKAEPGADVQLTIDTDLQYRLHQLVAKYKKKTGARGGSAVVLDAHTGEVYGLTNDTSFDPNDVRDVPQSQFANRAVTTPFEPGSVNKIVVATAAIKAGLVDPMTRVHVPSVLHKNGVTIHDDWTHPDQTYTVAGILAKSSNIGADLLAQTVGPKRFMAMARELGIGKRTGIAIPGESPGYLPARDTWSGSTFLNLPIGQGLSMTVLQMADMYQAIANDGVRVPPRIIDSVTKPDGTVVHTPQPEGERVVTPKQSDTITNILSHVTQDNGFDETGTARKAALPGYDIAGKTGTAQQVVDGRYSKSKITTTFAGILPAHNPRFVVGVMLDAPKRGESHTTVAPLFHDIASYLTQRYHIPMSKNPVPDVPLVVK